ncbi:MAG: hypothetical protein JSR87_13250 [Proteobacteria bacterium]|nr:hypothetical protein [Pseudomonadota bacterium]MBS0572560.1 hypothetical protein [Pseudomonadota bacterium]
MAGVATFAERAGACAPIRGPAPFPAAAGGNVGLADFTALTGTERD